MAKLRKRSKNLTFGLIVLATLVASSAFAIPQLKPSAELIESEKIKIKVLNNSEGVPPPTLVAYSSYYKAIDVWYNHSIVGIWKDKRGNVMRLTKVDSLPPSGAKVFSNVEEELIKKDEAEKSMAKAVEDFSIARDLKAWKEAWTPEANSILVNAKNGSTYLIEFEIVEPISPKEANKLLKTAADSLSISVNGMTSAYSTMKWWSEETENYKFLTDLDKSKGGKFIADSSRLTEAMRKAYEFYVPPTSTVGKCTVRVFKDIEGYRKYRASNGANDTMSCGLWDPSREELLIANAYTNREGAEKTMRHEGFHQYLHFASGRRAHAMWFNEGHATFFENVKYNGVKNEVKVTEGNTRAKRVAKNPRRYAAYLKTVIKLPYQEFYSGEGDEVALHYESAWALIYFLQKGAYASEKFKDYRKVIPIYLAAISDGLDPTAATEKAFECVKGRDLEEDFMNFWQKHRKAAEKAR